MNFLTETPEDASLNQYWYSEATLAALASELESGSCGKRVAFFSTPSVYFSLAVDSEIRRNSYLFDLDEQWSNDIANFRRFDYKDGADAIESSLCHTFDCAVIDPPFITTEVWECYARAARAALGSTGKLILTTVAENEAMLCSFFGNELYKTKFMPAMHRSALPYQYSLFVNYKLASISVLNSWNSEVPKDEFQNSNMPPRPNRDESSEQSLHQPPYSSAALSRMAVVSDAPLTGTGLSFDELLARELAREEEKMKR